MYNHIMGSKCEYSLPSQVQGHEANELKPLYLTNNEVKVVDFDMYTHTISHLEPNVIRAHSISTNALKSLFVAKLL